MIWLVNPAAATAAARVWYPEDGTAGVASHPTPAAVAHGFWASWRVGENLWGGETSRGTLGPSLMLRE